MSVLFTKGKKKLDEKEAVVKNTRCK